MALTVEARELEAYAVSATLTLATILVASGHSSNKALSELEWMFESGE
jgi:hypothetical protein